MSNFYLFLVVFIPMVATMMFMPYLTRKTLSFGVTIPADASESVFIRNLRKSFALVTLVIAILFAVAEALLAKWELAFPILMIGFIIVNYLIYYRYHNKMKTFKATQNWQMDYQQKLTVDTSFRHKKRAFSNGWFVFAFLITAASFFLSYFYYDRFPDRIPMHYDWDGTINRWADKSYRTVFSFPILQVYLLLLFMFINRIISRAKQTLDSDRPEHSVAQNIAFRKSWSAYLIMLGTLLIGLFGFIQLSMVIAIPIQVMKIVSIGLIVVILIGSMILSFVTRQGGSGLKGKGEKAGSQVMNRDDDQFWKLGAFYCNRQDPAIWVEKRFGIGWTINIANPLAWVYLGAILVIAILISIFSIL